MEEAEEPPKALKFLKASLGEVRHSFSSISLCPPHPTKGQAESGSLAFILRNSQFLIGTSYHAVCFSFYSVAAVFRQGLT